MTVETDMITAETLSSRRNLWNRQVATSKLPKIRNKEIVP